MKTGSRDQELVVMWLLYLTQRARRKRILCKSGNKLYKMNGGGRGKGVRQTWGLGCAIVGWLLACLRCLWKTAQQADYAVTIDGAGCDQWHSSFTDAPRSTEPGFAIRKALANAAQLSGLTGERKHT